MTRYLPLIANVGGALLLLVVFVGLGLVTFSVDVRLGCTFLLLAATPAGWRLATYGSNSEVDR